jgi:electron transport complex protein RnfC
MVVKLKFRHGVHPPEHKELTAGLKVRRMPFPSEVLLPLSQHAGRPAIPIVKPGDRVERGDKIAESDGFVSVPMHATAAGTVADIELHPHPMGDFQPAIRIEVDPNSAQAPRPRMVPEWEGLTPPQIVEAVQQAGVVGLGGAAFPTHVKLTPPREGQLDTLIVNGCECEPYLTTDHRTMVDYPERVQLGVRIMMRCLGVKRALIGIERNKPDAIEIIEKTLPSDLDVEVMPLTVKYPQGAEKMLIKAVLDREVPSGQLPVDVGAVVQNVASVATIAEVFETGLACGGLTDDAREIVNGGPMMGMAQANVDAPVIKGTTGIVVLTESEVKQRKSYPCIRCGHCLDACPVFLNPQLLGKLAQSGRYADMANGAHLRDCMLCGCCSYVCPSNIPLSQLFAVARNQLKRLPQQ